MMLEDHAGDIIHKARTTAKVPLATAATAAGLSPAELERLEATGACEQKPDWNALASVLGLHGSKLEAVAHGWLPQPPELRRWRELRPITTTQGGNTVNCYLLWDPSTRSAALFDTGWNLAPIQELIEENRLELKYLFLTHSHQDHVAALKILQITWPNVVLFFGPLNQCPALNKLLTGFMTLGSLCISARETPGHSEDGVTYVINNFLGNPSPVAMVGDCLFAGSMGRGFQSAKLLKQKVQKHILSLPAETLLCPGHGPLTTVAQEKAQNPFFP